MIYLLDALQLYLTSFHFTLVNILNHWHYFTQPSIVRIAAFCVSVLQSLLLLPQEGLTNTHRQSQHFTCFCRSFFFTKAESILLLLGFSKHQTFEEHEGKYCCKSCCMFLERQPMCCEKGKISILLKFQLSSHKVWFGIP